jgi:hypothetical protein
MRGGNAGDVLRAMDSCRIRWGRVLEVTGEQLVVSAPRLELVEGQLRVGAAVPETVRRTMNGLGLVDRVGVGDVVSIHWDWACDRLEPGMLDALQRSTDCQIRIANQTI